MASGPTEREGIHGLEWNWKFGGYLDSTTSDAWKWCRMQKDFTRTTL